MAQNGGTLGADADRPGHTTDAEGATWFETTFSLPWIVTHAESGQDAINIAVSEVGKRVARTSDTVQNIDIGVQTIGCSACSTTSDALLLVSNTALVGLLLTADVRAENPSTAEAVGRREIGPHLPDTPLTTIDAPHLEDE